MADFEPLTVVQAINIKLAAAREDLATADAKVKELEAELAALPESFKALSYDEAIKKIGIWFAPNKA